MTIITNTTTPIINSTHVSDRQDRNKPQLCLPQRHRWQHTICDMKLSAQALAHVLFVRGIRVFQICSLVSGYFAVCFEIWYDDKYLYKPANSWPIQTSLYIRTITVILPLLNRSISRLDCSWTSVRLTILVVAWYSFIFFTPKSLPLPSAPSLT